MKRVSCITRLKSSPFFFLVSKNRFNNDVCPVKYHHNYFLKHVTSTVIINNTTTTISTRLLLKNAKLLIIYSLNSTLCWSFFIYKVLNKISFYLYRYDIHVSLKIAIHGVPCTMFCYQINSPMIKNKFLFSFRFYTTFTLFFLCYVIYIYNYDL